MQDADSANVASKRESFTRKSLRRSRLVSNALEAARSHVVAQGYSQASHLFENKGSTPSSQLQSQSPGKLQSYFDSHSSGHGVFKWKHYFEMYERHLAKFVDRAVTLCEIGVYSGGSLQMWKHYFGPGCRVHGVDIEPACKIYETENVKIHIGDQSDRNFWKHFREEVPSLDVVIDDGGHSPDQQITTLEETLPHLNPGGVYICEDIHGIANRFTRYVNGFTLSLNAAQDFTASHEKERAITAKASPFQSAVHSVSFYPFVVVIERNTIPIDEFIAEKRGTSWQPHL